VTDLLTLSLAASVGFQAGLIVSWRYYKRQRDDMDNTRRQHERERELLEIEIKHERKDRRRAEEDHRGRCSRS